MVTEDRTYVIEPGATDPDLIRNMAPLGEAVEEAQPQARARQARRGRVGTKFTRSRIEPAIQPPSRPVVWLLSAYVLGPFALLLAPGGYRSPRRWIAPTAAVLTVAVAAIIWRLDPATLGGGDQSFLVQGGAVAAAAVVWLALGAVGLVTAARRCVEGPLSQRAARRPVAACLTGLVMPGLGLLLAGRRVRSAVAVATVGLGVAAALLFTRAASWWAAHRAAGDAAVLDDLEIELIFLVLAAVAAFGAIGWLVSALEGGRLAAGPRVVRAISGADRVPAAFMLALVALVVFFRPTDAALEIDRLTDTLVAHELRLAPLWTARAAARLAPAEPVLELRVAERLDALDRREDAAAVRDRLQSRWESLDQATGGAGQTAPVEPELASPMTAAWERPSAPSPLLPDVDRRSPPPSAP